MKIKCKKCTDYYCSLNHKALNDYFYQCSKLCISPHKFFPGLIEKNELYFDLINYASLTIDEVTSIQHVLSNYPVWQSVIIVNTAKFNNHSSSLNTILKILSPNVTKFTSVISLAFIGISLTEEKNLRLLYNMIVRNKSILTYSFINCNVKYSPKKPDKKANKTTWQTKWLEPKPKSKAQIALEQFSFSSILKGIASRDGIENIYLNMNGINDLNCDSVINLVKSQSQKKKARNWVHTLHNGYSLSSLPIKYNSNSLMFISLSHNMLGSRFTSEIVPVLESDAYLRQIDLSNNNLNKKDCGRFASLLKVNRTLLNLDLSGNHGYEKPIKIKVIYRLSCNLSLFREQFDSGEIGGEEYKEILDKYVDKELFEELETEREEIIKEPEDILDEEETKEMFQQALLRIKNLEEENKKLRREVMLQKGHKRAKSSINGNNSTVWRRSVTEN